MWQSTRDPRFTHSAGEVSFLAEQDTKVAVSQKKKKKSAKLLAQCLTWSMCSINWAMGLREFVLLRSPLSYVFQILQKKKFIYVYLFF